LGNLVARVAKLCEKAKADFPAEENLGFSSGLSEKIDQLRFDSALEQIWTRLTSENKRINEGKPWELTEEKLTEFLKPIVTRLRQIAFDLQPFMPITSQKILAQFKGPKIKSTEALFPRIKP